MIYQNKLLKKRRPDQWSWQDPIYNNRPHMVHAIGHLHSHRSQEEWVFVVYWFPKLRQWLSHLIIIITSIQVHTTECDENSIRNRLQWKWGTIRCSWRSEGVFHIRQKVAWEQIELTVTHSYLRRSFVTPRAFVSHSRFMLCGVLGHVGDTDGHLIVSQGEMDGWALMNNFHRL